MREHGVAEAGAPGDQLAALVVQLDGVDDQARVEPDRDAGGRVGRDDRGAEQQVAERLRLLQRGDGVDDGLRQAERVALGDVDDAGAVAAERGGRGVVGVAQHQGVHGLGQGGSEARGLLDQAQRALRVRAVLALRENEDAGHQTTTLRSTRKARIFSAAVPSSSIFT